MNAQEGNSEHRWWHIFFTRWIGSEWTDAWIEKLYYCSKCDMVKEVSSDEVGKVTKIQWRKPRGRK